MKITLVDVLHWASGILLLLVGGLAETGFNLPGVTVDPKVAIVGGIGILAAGLKAGVTSGK